MKKRKKMPKAKSKRHFSGNAGHHIKNDMTSSGGSMAMRGGIRL